MQLLLVFLCCGSLVITTAFGLGITFVLERFLGIWAYVAGALLPVIIFTACYTLYHIYIRATPCEPVGSLACGEPFFAAFVLFFAVAIVMLLANVAAQTSLYLFLYGRRQPIPAGLYEQDGQEADGTEGAPADIGAAYPETSAVEQTGAVEFAEEQYTEEQYTEEQPTDDSPYSGLPPGAPEDEPK